MAESTNGGNQQPAKSPWELSMETRLLIAFGLMAAVMFFTPYFFKTPPPAPGKKTAQTEQTQSAAAPPAAEAPAKPSEVEQPAEPSAAPPTPTIFADALPPLVIDTSLYRIVFSNQGASIRSWQLKRYKGNDGKPLDLVNPTAAAKAGYPFSLYFPGQKPTAKINEDLYKQTADPDGLGATFEFSDGHTAVQKVFRFQKNSYLSQVTASASVDGKPIPSMIEWRGGFGDLTLANPSGVGRTLYFNLTDNKLVEQNAKVAKNGPVTASGNFSFAGLADPYFAAVFLPEGAESMQQMTFSDTAGTPLDPKEVPFTGTALTDGATNRFDLFVGPKDVDLLKRINPKLQQVVDFGWMAFLAKPLFLIVNWFNDALVHNFGWSIVVVTIVLNCALFPIKLSNMKSMRKMQALKPQIDEINARYKGIGISDPRKGKQNQEVMDLYKKYGVNPMGGCFPMLIQIPFFFAFYKVFTVSVEMRGATWLWVTDLSQPEHLAIKILPITMIATQFFMQKMMPQPNQDPNQARMMMFMPLIFGVMFYNFPSGLVLYYLTSNLVSMGQQWFFNHTEIAQQAARSVEPAKKKNTRK